MTTEGHAPQQESGLDHTGVSCLSSLAIELPMFQLPVIILADRQTGIRKLTIRCENRTEDKMHDKNNVHDYLCHCVFMSTTRFQKYKNLLQRHNYACFSLRLSSMNEMQFYDDFQVCFSAVKF